MYLEIAVLISIILIVLYIYFTTRSKISILVICFAIFYAAYFYITESILDSLKNTYPNISFESPFVGFIIMLFQIFIPLGVIAMMIGIRLSKGDTYLAERQNFKAVLRFTKKNIFFWILVMSIILLGYLLERI